MQAWKAPQVPVLPHPEDRAPLRVHDTARGELVPIGPDRGTARLYVCGITPYDATHLGHANTYVTFDLLGRAWRDLGLNVNYVQNVTDVDDPLLERASATGVEWRELAERETELFRTDMTALRVLPPDDYIGAVEGIPLVIDLLQQMPEGVVYRADGEHDDYYFDVHAARGFGDVSGLDATAMRTLFAERGGDPARPGKRDPLDCLVWRAHREGEPQWDSPFGPGRPGWHIECAAIAQKFLGATFDVQGGGSDLVFPHHEMSAAEAEVATGEPFAAAYVHAGMVGLDGEKMSKSRGNLVLVSKLREQGVDPMAIRLALLSHHYRTDWSWTDALLEEARSRLGAWRDAVALGATLPASDVLTEVRAALADDLDAPRALAAIDAWASAAQSVDGDDTDAPALVRDLCDALLGVRL